MSFLYPQFLWALSLLAIPIIVHLFNFRRYKKVYFTNVQFLKDMKEQTTTRSRLKHLLVLFSRLLAVSFLVFAFAQPFIPKNKNDVEKTSKVVSVYIDNSFSMDAVGEEQSLVETAKRKAADIANAYSAETQFQLITNDFEGRHQRLLSRDEFITAIDEVKISPASHKLSEVVSRQKQALNQSTAETKLVYLLSDYQENITDLVEDSSIIVNMVPIESNRGMNVAIDSCWFISPVQMLNQTATLLVSITNHGEEAVENGNITLHVNDKTTAISDFTVAAHETVTDTLSFTISETGWQKTEVTIEDFPITFDDQYYLCFHVAEKINLLSISEQTENPYINAMFADNNFFALTNNNSGQLDYSSFNQYQLIVITSLKTISSGLAFQLKEYLNSGGSVLIFPHALADKNSYNTFLSSVNASTLGDWNTTTKQVSKINTEQEIFKDVFDEIKENINLPSAKSSFSFISNARSGEEPLLKFSDNTSFLSKFGIEKGSLYLCASPLDQEITDLPVHAIFVPMIYKMAINGIRSGKLSYTIGKDNLVEVTDQTEHGETGYKIKGETIEFTPSRNVAAGKLRLGIEGQIQQSGFYEIIIDDAENAEQFAENYDRKESVMKFYSAEQLKEQFENDHRNIIESAGEDFSVAVAEMNHGNALWKLCVIFTLLFLAIEILLLRFLR